jgi:hypothetical protein
LDHPTRDPAVRLEQAQFDSAAAEAFLHPRHCPRHCPRLAGASDRLDQLPLAHLGSTRNASLLCNLIELLAGSVFKRTSRFPTSSSSFRCLPAKITASGLWKLGDGLLHSGRGLSPFDVALCRLDLLRRSHAPHLPLPLVSFNNSSTPRLPDHSSRQRSAYFRRVTEPEDAARSVDSTAQPGASVTPS